MIHSFIHSFVPLPICTSWHWIPSFPINPKHPWSCFSHIRNFSQTVNIYKYMFPFIFSWSFAHIHSCPIMLITFYSLDYFSIFNQTYCICGIANKKQDFRFQEDFRRLAALPVYTSRSLKTSSGPQPTPQHHHAISALENICSISLTIVEYFSLLSLAATRQTTRPHPKAR